MFGIRQLAGTWHGTVRPELDLKRCPVVYVDFRAVIDHSSPGCAVN